MEDLLSKQYFQEVSSQWDVMSNEFFGDAPRKIIYDHLDLQPGMKIADIGSGSGYLLEGLSDQPVELYAIDQSEAMLDQLRTKYSDASNVQSYSGTSEDLPLQDESMDVVMANMYLHHVEHPPMAISEMARILKPGGTLIFTDLDEHDYEQLIEEQHDRWKGFNRKDIIEWMASAGMSDVTVDCVGSDCCTQSREGQDISINIFIAKGIKS